MQKKNAKIIIILIIFFLIMFGFVYYYFFFKKTPSQDEFNLGNNVGLFPGNEQQPGGGNNSGGKQTSVGVEASPVPKYRKISQKPISGGIIVENIDKKNTDGDIIRYMDRATGHIYETRTGSMKQERISNATIPKVQELFWNKNGDEIIARYLDEGTDNIISFYGKLTLKQNIAEGTKTDIYSLDGSFLQKNISDISMSPNGKNLFYIIKKQGTASGIKSGLGTTSGVEIFNSPLTEWLPEWTDGGIFLTTKPSYKTDGFVFKLSDSGDLTKIIGGIPGLTVTTKNDGLALLYSRSSNSSFGLFSYKINDRESSELKIKTLPEKCVWSKKNKTIIYCAVPRIIPSGQYPDDWYMGLTTFDDMIWMIDTNINIGSIVADPNKYSEPPVDAINLRLNADESYLMFTNKKDYSLWGIDMKSYQTEELPSDYAD